MEASSGTGVVEASSGSSGETGVVEASSGSW